MGRWNNNGFVLFVSTSVIRSSNHSLENRSLIFEEKSPFHRLCTSCFGYMWTAATVLRAEINHNLIYRPSLGSFELSEDSRVSPKVISNRIWHCIYCLGGEIDSWCFLLSIFLELSSTRRWKLLSCVQLFVTPWTVALQAPLVHEILQARILEWVAIPFSRGSSQPRDQTQVSHIAGRFFTVWAT